MLHRLRNAAVLTAAVLVVACHPSTTTPPSSGHDGGDPHGDGGTSPGAGGPRPRPGAAHTSNIDRVVVSADGSMAMSRDQIGRLRAWTRLDGSVEPLVVPATGATSMSIEPRGKDGAATVAVVESSGAAKIYAVAADGTVEETGALPPFAPLNGAWVLPGGERVLALFKDHTIRLLGRDASELGRLEERNFRPTRLIPGDDASAFVVLSRDGADTTLQRATVRDTTIALVPGKRTVRPGTALSESTSDASGDGRRFGYVDRVNGATWDVVTLDLTKAEGERRFQVQLPTHVTPALGFSHDHQLLVTGSDGSLSWLLDVDEGARRPRPAAPQDFVNQGRAQAMRGGTHVAANGTWLFVHDVVQRRHRFLGYRSLQAQAVAVSPDSRYVAWAYAQGPLLVEAFDGQGPTTEVDLHDDANFGVFRVEFVDEDRVVAADAMGGIRLVSWKDSRVLDHVGLTGGIRNLQFDRNSGLLLAERHNNDAAVYQVTDEGFEGPWIIADGSFRMGLLDHGAPGHPKALVWTLDSSNRVRHYRMEHLRGDLTHAETDALGRELPQGEVAPLAVDRTGRRYGVRWNGTTMELFADDGKEAATLEAPAGDINMLFVADDGSRFVAVHQRGSSTTLTAHDGKTLEELWSYSSGTFNSAMGFSPDGKWVSIAASTGAVLLDAKTGKPVRQRCGIEFSVSGSPPQNAFNGQNLPSLCEI